ncbi:CocE/NonD family hydrolase [Nocardia terpenica]|nr:CocE/NonD family hydrolase [Nocardia terpenica]MBF6059638.1 CocE/NonD family hydrolase [Nocardia terpenica]MBF6102821.1 CocE/NonD family hydrolase [Nocardia terpenica]MBF6110988.1 CocE/NonD family hydrolase [Nocardia terpenica]MBF6117119.1 CocE/NonD family hydrolase [Nocardia terpenica]MBF6151041.1 CocE/NonD family hydrolase [Nocardia terpenica]
MSSNRKRRNRIVRAGAIAAAVALIAGGCGGSSTSSGGGGQPVAEKWPPATGRGPCAVTKQENVPATMRDGVVLQADVYRPQTSDPVPVILMRTQYGKSEAQVEPYRYQSPDWFASHCYLVVVQDIRGQGKSGGTFTEFADDRNDGYDSVEWAAALPGSDGKVGMYGSSYVGATQWLAATAAPPHLTTIVPANTASDYYDGWTYDGGEFRLAFIEPWAMGTIGATAAQNRGDTATAKQLRADSADYTKWLAYRPYQQFPPMHPGDPAVAPWFFDWMRHSSRDDYWKQWSIRDRYASVKVPVLDFEGWYDAFLAGGVENFAGMVKDGGSDDARRNQRLVIGPWDHVGWGRPGSHVSAPMLAAAGAPGDSPINDLMLSWYDHFLKGKDTKVAGKPTVDYFLMGANRWKTATAWPLPNTRWTTYYLSGNGGGGVAGRAGKLVTGEPKDPQQPDHYYYDPLNPVPSAGGHSCCGASTGPQGPYDQYTVEQRSDVLTYTTDPLPSDTEITGPIQLKLWAASSATDTDFTAKLVAVAPDGSSVNLNNGILRTAFRDSLDHPTPMVPGQPYPLTIKIWPTSYLVKAGYRIRVEVSSSDYPQYAPNPNTGEPFGQSANAQGANQTIFHDADHPSAVVLPIIPSGDAGSATFPMTN